MATRNTLFSHGLRLCPGTEVDPRRSLVRALDRTERHVRETCRRVYHDPDGLPGPVFKMTYVHGESESRSADTRGQTAVGMVKVSGVVCANKVPVARAVASSLGRTSKSARDGRSSQTGLYVPRTGV